MRTKSNSPHGMQTWIARKTGITRSTVASIFNGKRRATVDQAKLLAPLLASLGLNIDSWALVSCPPGTKLLDLARRKGPEKENKQTNSKGENNMDIKTKFNIGDEVCHRDDVLDFTVHFDIVHDIIINSRGVFYNVVPEGHDLLDDTLEPIPEGDLILGEKVLRARTAIVKFLNEELDK